MKTGKLKALGLLFLLVTHAHAATLLEFNFDEKAPGYANGYLDASGSGKVVNFQPKH